MPGMTISPDLASARESARAADGRFGTQARTAPRDDVEVLVLRVVS